MVVSDQGGEPHTFTEVAKFGGGFIPGLNAPGEQMAQECSGGFANVAVAKTRILQGSQVNVPIEYKGIRFDEGFRADIIVDGRVILELQSIERVMAAHKKQVQTYLRLTGCKLGYLLNFGEALMKSGINRCVNGLEE